MSAGDSDEALRRKELLEGGVRTPEEFSPRRPLVFRSAQL
jgi:hypothetical protein